MKKYITIVLAAVMAVFCLSACSQKDLAVETTDEQSIAEGQSITEDQSTEVSQNEQENIDEEVIRVVTTIFPEYDWVRQIAGEEISHIDLTMLLDNGVDLHSYQPTADDIAKISDCDLFIYVGGESDEWVEDALKEAVNKDMKVINLLEVLGDAVKEEEIVEGMQETEHSHSHEKKEVSEDRTLSDYEGEWQSLYPFMDEKFKNETVSYMAEAEGFDDEDEAWDFFYKGNETDIRYVNINGNKIEFEKEDGTKETGTYEYDGFYSDCWGETSIRYQFKNTDTNSDAPAYVQFDDHLNYPSKAEHFHLYCGDDAKAMLDIKYNWPTYYPADIQSEDDMIHEFLKHYVDEEEEHEEEKDEHVWLSLKNAETLCQTISADLQEIDPENKDVYAANASAYLEKLSVLDTAYQSAADAASQKTLLFGDRFPFRYLVDDYGLSYYAAFVGCSAETEASFETITFLAGKVDELGLHSVLTLENSDQKIAKTIIENTSEKNQEILTLDSMQSTTSADVANGTTYLSVMENNLNVLKKALQ